jgi:hypothetical protein
MKYQLKKNTAAEEAFVRDLQACGTLQNVERGQARVLPLAEYPEPLKRFLVRQRTVLHVRLSAPARRQLEKLSVAKDISSDRLARQWVEQGIAREAS